MNEAVRASIVAEPRPSSPDLDAHIERRWNETVAEAAREGHLLFDGAVLRWLRHELDATSGREARLHLIVGRGSYRDFVGTNLDSSLAPDLAGGAVPWIHFGNAIGTSAIVATRDGKLVAGRRSRRVFGYRNHVHSFGGMLEGVDVTEDVVDVFASMRRELSEELAIAPAEIHELTLNGIIVDPGIHQPELLFDVRVPLSARELRERWKSAVSQDEHSDLLEFPDDPAEIEAALARAAPVSPIGRACFALHFSR